MTEPHSEAESVDSHEFDLREGREIKISVCPRCKDVIYTIRNPFNKSYKFRCTICEINFNMPREDTSG